MAGKGATPTVAVEFSGLHTRARIGKTRVRALLLPNANGALKDEGGAGAIRRSFFWLS